MKYIFILGNNPQLSRAEIEAVLPTAKILAAGRQFLVLENEKLDCQKTLNLLGGTVKIGIVIGSKIDEGAILGSAMSWESGKRFNFGFSFYGLKPSQPGMRIKGLLKAKGINSRLVVSREPALSSVIVTKEKCHDFLVLPDFFGLTCAVQEFEKYSKFDYGRPASDAYSGMVPPKLAKMMVNLSGAGSDDVLLDPFCGSGTILSLAMDLGCKNLIGCDLSDKAVADSQKNLDWLKNNLSADDSTDAKAIFNFKIFKADARKLSGQLKNQIIDVIVTEPYLGQPMKGNEKEGTIRKIVGEVESLYLDSIIEFQKLLKAGGRVVMVFPEWHIGGKVYDFDAAKMITVSGYRRLDKGDLIYKRDDQKVWRKIIIFEK